MQIVLPDKVSDSKFVKNLKPLLKVCGLRFSTGCRVITPFKTFKAFCYYCTFKKLMAPLNFSS